MRSPRLRQRITNATLPPAVARTFADGLRALVALDPDQAPTKQQLIDRLMGDDPVVAAEPAPFDALWPHAELFLTACIYVAVTDGQYGVEEARHVSGYAHRLGLSARQLERLEAKVFAELVARSQSKAAEEAHTDVRGLP